jgi:hypothetical protein
MKNKRILTALLLTLTTTFSSAVIIPSIASITQQRVQFKAGSNSAVKEGTIKGSETIDYVLNAKKGQSANISLASKSGSIYFNILEPGQNEVAIFNGSTSGNQFEGTLNKSGDYKIRVYLMRSAARNNETANYRLEMIVN